MTLPPDAIARLANDGVEPTNDLPKFHSGSVESRIVAIWDGHEFKEQAEAGAPVGLILDNTPFYADQGGQIGDTGRYVAGDSIFQINQTRRFGDYVLHEGSGGRLDLDSSGMACIDQDKRDHIEANHTATHLLNLALRSTLGADVQQKGSLVSADRLRFDFSCRSAPSSDQLEQIEADVNTSIKQALDVNAAEMPLDAAMKINGVRAVFGERYPDPVRVVSIGASSADLIERPEDPTWMEHSIEFCGGTHLDNTSRAGDFLLIQEQGLAAGIRRVSALTGTAAREAIERGRALSVDVQDAADCEDLELANRIDAITKRVDEETLGLLDRERIRTNIESLRARVKAARKSAAKSSKNEAVALARSLSEEAGGDVIVSVMDGVVERDDLLAAMDTIRGSHPDSACMLLGTDLEAGKVVMVARVPDLLIKRGLKAGNWIKHVASLCGEAAADALAQAGGSKPEAREAAADGTSWAKEQLT